MPALRKSGIDILGEIPWGSHFCNFYETKQDLLDTLVPYFKTGLESKEFCLWIVSNSGLLTVEDAKDALEQVVPGLDQHLLNNDIEILNETNWYLEEDVFKLEKVINEWHAKLNRALALGYEGMRVSGDTFWLNEKIWKDFFAYEKQVNDFAADLPVTMLCTYPLRKSRAAEMLDVVHAHQFAIARRQGEWEVIESPKLIQAKAEIKKLNEELEQRVVERTQQLEKAIRELKYEISEREKIEAELKESELRYRTLIEQASDAIIITDEDGHLIEVNTSFCKMVGYTEKELMGMDITSLYDSEHLKADPLRFDLLLEGKVLFRERLMKKKDGKVFQIEVHVKMVGDKRILAIVRDITGRKQAEDALRQSEDRIRLIIDTIPTMAWSQTPDGIVDFLNQRWVDYTGLFLEKYIKEPTGPIHPEDIPGVMEKWLVNKAAGKAFDNEIRLRGADGEYRWFLVRTAPLHDEQGNLVKWYGVSIDIEDSKRAEDELRLAYQRLSYHVENTPLAVIEFDQDLCIKRWSKRAVEIFGWETSEALGKNVYDTDFPIIYKDDVPAVDRINEQLTKGVVNSNLSLNRNYTKDGNVIYCEWYNSVLRDEHGNAITILSLVLDVTERKKAEETLNKSYEEIRRLTEHLQKIREEERTSIARDIHDELGQQLTALTMEVKGLNKKLNDADEGIKQEIGDIINLLDSMVKSVRRISSELRPSLLYNLGLVAAIEWHLKEFEKRSGTKTIFNGPKEELELPDSIKKGLFRIFQESLTNVSRHANANKVNVILEQKDQQLFLSIEDNGQGFEKENIAVKDTLGILGMKERSQMMGGNYEIISIPGKGTTIIIAVPYNEKNNLI
jgi:PAS domain S-box-containing protein